MLKSLMYMLLVMCVYVCSFSATSTLWPNTEKLNAEAKQTCLQFKLLNGSNRVTEFSKISSILFDKTFNKSSTISCKTYNTIDVEKILGKPTEILQNGSWVYNLNPNEENCKVIIVYIQ